MFFKGVIITAGIVLIAIAVVLAINSQGFFEDSNDVASTDSSEKALQIARQFVLSSPTFSFDGMDETLEIELMSIRESFPEQYVIKVEYSSLHGGYGDRTGLTLTQTITPHQMEVIVVNEKVISAIIDERWDEVNQIPCRAASC